MNAREFLDLQDAYQDVYQELDEAMMDGPRKDKMITKQHSPYVSSRDRANAFNIGVRDDRPRDKKSTGGKGERYSDFGDRGAGNKSRRRRGLEPIHGNTRKEEVDLFDYLLEYLVAEGYADTNESALAIMANMSEDWKESICEEYKKLPLGKMMKKVQKRATREADTRAEIEYDPTFPTMKALKASEKASRENKRSDTIINVADTHSKEAAKSRSKFRK